jgi:hypothetical protein
MTTIPTTTTNNQNPTDVFNNFLQQIKSAQSSILCGPDCQHTQKEALLKKAYSKAQTNFQIAPTEIKTTFKNYYTFKNGPNAYDNYIEQQYQENAQKMIAKFQDRIHTIIDKIKNDLETYITISVYYSNVNPVFKTYKQHNWLLEKNIKTTNANTITNKRLTFYESEGIDNLTNLSNMLFALYCIVCFSYIVFIAISNKITVINKIVSVLFFAIYPYIIIPLIHYVIDCYYSIYGYLPINTYLQ